MDRSEEQARDINNNEIRTFVYALRKIFSVIFLVFIIKIKPKI